MPSALKDSAVLLFVFYVVLLFIAFRLFACIVYMFLRARKDYAGFLRGDLKGSSRDEGIEDTANPQTRKPHQERKQRSCQRRTRGEKAEAAEERMGA